MVTRRAFLRLTAAGGGILLLRPGVFVRAVRADALPGGTLDPTSIARFVRELVVPPAMPRRGVRRLKGGVAADWYDIAVRQFRQEVVPDHETTVWGYGSVRDPETFNYPAFTVEARWRRPVAVRWRNELVDGDGRFLPHLLPVDPTLHWANPPGGEEHRDSRPTFETTPGPYGGPVPIVTHLHGAAKVGDESDGYAEAWYLPDAEDIPSGYAEVGTWYRFFADKWERRFGSRDVPSWRRGTAIAAYPNDQRASTLWYHDHTLGMTRLNVYAGPAGFYLLRGGPDDRVVDARTGERAVLPGPAPRRGDGDGDGPYREIPIVIQDRAFDADGELFYPGSRSFFDGVAGPYVPETDVSPIWNPEFFGNVMVVNGRSWPRLVTERRRYRFRLLNGCDSRFLILRFDHPRVEVWQIGTDGGFLPRPLDLNAVAEGRILLAPAERADVIVDFTDVPAGTDLHLLNLGPDEPFGGGLPGVDFVPSDPSTTGQVMRFDVVPAASRDRSTPPARLRLPSVRRPRGGRRRRVALIEEMSGAFEDAPVAALLGVVRDGSLVPKMWHDAITENPGLGSTEVWELVNATADAHPIHVHEVQFSVVDRQRLALDPDGNVTQPVRTVGDRRPPEAWERGFKDTVIAYPGEVTRIRLRFETPGNYVWHCHILSHEDNEMMRPYRIGPVQHGSPET